MLTERIPDPFGGAITAKLMKQQRMIVQFAQDKKYVGIFGDYGVGKSLAALAIIAHHRMRYVLVVSTKTAIESTWPTEIQKHSKLRYFRLQGTRRAKLQLLRRGLQTSYTDSSYYYDRKNECAHTVIFLINYDGVKNIAPELAEVKFDGLFLDESRKIKSPHTKRTKYIWALGWTCKRRYLLTGFPVSEWLAELYTQVKFLDGGKAFGNSYYRFVHENFVRQGPHLVPKRVSVKKILAAIAPFCIRITNKHLNLPPVVRQTLELKKTPQQEKALKELNEMFMLEFGKVQLDIQYIFSLISRSLQICDGYIEDLPPKDPKTGKPIRKPIREIIATNKDEALVELLEEIDPIKNKVVIWANHIFAVRKIALILGKIYRKQRVTVLELSGQTENAKTIVDLFQTKKGYNILVASIRKAAESITLTKARYNIYYGHQWSFDVRDNSEARTRRIGSEHHPSIVYIDMVTKGTIERHVVTCIQRKGDLIKDLKQQFLQLDGRKKTWE